MPKAKFDIIYYDLKRKIEERDFLHQELLPSENTLAAEYSCSRNTVRRALSMLINEGYIQSQHGKGVWVIYEPTKQKPFTFSGIETFKESAARNNMKVSTKVIKLTEMVCDSRIAAKTGFPENIPLLYVQRVRFLDNKPLILDINVFCKELVGDLTEEICSSSIYDYIENILGMKIVTSKRKITAEHATQIDTKYLELKNCDFVAAVTSQTYNSNGIMFEYTQSRHHPEYFCFEANAIRKSK